MLDEKIIYYYRNGCGNKEIAKKTGLTIGQVKYRLEVIRRTRKVLRWWEEDTV